MHRGVKSNCFAIASINYAFCRLDITALFSINFSTELYFRYRYIFKFIEYDVMLYLIT